MAVVQSLYQGSDRDFLQGPPKEVQRFFLGCLLACFPWAPNTPDDNKDEEEEKAWLGMQTCEQKWVYQGPKGTN